MPLASLAKCDQDVCLELLLSTLDEKREEAVMKVLASINSQREYQEAMEHMGVNIQVGRPGEVKRIHLENNIQRLFSILDGNQRERFKDINNHWLKS